MSRSTTKTGIISTMVVIIAIVVYIYVQKNSSPNMSTPSAALSAKSPLPSFTPPILAKPVNSLKTADNVLHEDLQGTSLKGTDIDRSMLLVVDGQLVLNAGLLFYFDYFLTLQGEMSLAEIRQLVWRDLQAHYPETIAKQIDELFQHYLSYLDEIAEREASVTEEEILAQHLSAIDMQNEVRRHHFSEEEIAALFGSYDAMLGKPSQASLQQKNYDQYQQAKKENPEQQEAVATELYGPVAAQNLRNVQYERQQWDGRVANFEREKKLIMQSYDNDIEGRQQALELLQQRLFTETERRRVQALERIHQNQQ